MHPTVTIERYVKHTLYTRDIQELRRLAKARIMWYELCPRCFSKNVYIATDWVNKTGRYLLVNDAPIRQERYIVGRERFKIREHCYDVTHCSPLEDIVL